MMSELGPKQFRLYAAAKGGLKNVDKKYCIGIWRIQYSMYWFRTGYISYSANCSVTRRKDFLFNSLIIAKTTAVTLGGTPEEINCGPAKYSLLQMHPIL
jgi:hypothetical protein